MQYRKLGSSDLEVSVIGLGTWAMGGDYYGKVDDSESVRAIHAAIDQGINLIDTAPAYGAGHSEEVVGRALHEISGQERPVIATKVGIIRTADGFLNNLKPESVRREIDDSLRRLGVDSIDLYQIHWPDPETALEDTLAELEKIKDAGKFRYLGVSNFSVDFMETCNRIFPIVSLQPNYSLLERQIEQDVLPYCRNQEIGTLGYGTYAGGILTGKFKEIPFFEPGDERAQFYDYFRQPLWDRVQHLIEVLRDIASAHSATVAEVARNWAIREDGGVTAALVGVKSVRQAEENASGTDWNLNGEELSRIESAWSIMSENDG